MHHFQVCLCASCIRTACFLRKSTELHDMRTKCQIIRIIVHFLLCIIYFDHFLITRAQIFSLTYHSLPNPLLPACWLHNAHSPIAHSPQFLDPWSLACSHPPGLWSYAVQLAPWSLNCSHQPCFGQTCFPIACSLPPTQSLVFCPPPYKSFPRPISSYFLSSNIWSGYSVEHKSDFSTKYR